MDNERFKFFTSCAPGLESILEIESRQLKMLPIRDEKPAGAPLESTDEESGGILFEGTYTHLMRCNLHLRTASRIVIRLGEFYAAAFSELRKKAAKLEWGRYIRPGQKVNIRATCRKSKLYHSDAVAERVLGAINDHFGVGTQPVKACTQDAEGQQVLVRIVNDLCTISIDSSGDLLHKRGYRQAVAKAPLRETLAAAMLIGSGWDARSAFIDPFCGSGTLPIEAALLAGNIAPGIARSFAFMNWPAFKSEPWQELLENARKNIQPVKVNISGFDRDAGAIEMAKANAARAGQMETIQFQHQAVSYLKATSNVGWLVTNPPYGLRTEENKDLRDLYARFGEILRSEFAGWHVGILCSDRQLSGNLKLGDPARVLQFRNGGIPVRFEMYFLT